MIAILNFGSAHKPNLVIIRADSDRLSNSRCAQVSSTRTLVGLDQQTHRGLLRSPLRRCCSVLLVAVAYTAICVALVLLNTVLLLHHLLLSHLVEAVVLHAVGTLHRREPKRRLCHEGHFAEHGVVLVLLGTEAHSWRRHLAHYAVVLHLLQLVQLIHVLLLLLGLVLVGVVLLVVVRVEVGLVGCEASDVVLVDIRA